MTNSSDRRGASNFAPVLMGLSFVAIGGFLYWLSVTAEGTETVAMNPANESSVETADSLEIAAMPTDLQQVEDDPGQYVGELVRIRSRVESSVGSAAFYVEVPQSVFLVHMSDELLDEGRLSPPNNAQVVVTGVLYERTDSVLEAWRESGQIGENDVLVIDFASHFVEAQRVRVTGGAPPTGAQGGAAPDTSGEETDDDSGAAGHP